MIYNKYSDFNNAFFIVDFYNKLYDTYSVHFFPGTNNIQNEYSFEFKLKDLLIEKDILYTQNKVFLKDNVVFNVILKMNENILTFEIKNGLEGEYNIVKNNRNFINVYGEEIKWQEELFKNRYLITDKNYIIKMNRPYFTYHRLYYNDEKEDYLNVVFRDEKNNITHCILKFSFL